MRLQERDQTHREGEKHAYRNEYFMPTSMDRVSASALCAHLSSPLPSAICQSLRWLQYNLRKASWLHMLCVKAARSLAHDHGNELAATAAKSLPGSQLSMQNADQCVSGEHEPGMIWMQPYPQRDTRLSSWQGLAQLQCAEARLLPMTSAGS